MAYTRSFWIYRRGPSGISAYKGFLPSTGECITKDKCVVLVSKLFARLSLFDLLGAPRGEERGGCTMLRMMFMTI